VLAVITAIATYALTLYLTPLGFRTFKDRQFTVRSSFASVLIQEGVFNELMQGITVYIRDRGSNGELLGILVHDNRNAKEPVTIMAELGLLVDTSEGPRFIMENGNRQMVGQDTRQLSLLYFDKYALDLGLIAASPENRWREAGERYLGELWNPGPGHDNEKNADRFLAEVHKRLTVPLHAIVFALIAAAGLLSGDFNRRGEARRIAMVSVLALTFEITSLALVPLISQTPTMAPLMYLNVAFACGLAIWWLGRQRFRRRTPIYDENRPVNA
jgi:lipopolysaccharide export system permease protein